MVQRGQKILEGGRQRLPLPLTFHLMVPWIIDFPSLKKFKVPSAGPEAKPLLRNKGTHSVTSGVARAPCAWEKKYFCAPPLQKLPSLK